MDLADCHSALVLELRDGVTLVSGGASAADLASIFEALSTQFQALAICHFFEFVDVDQFRENLLRSGHARRYFLRRSRIEGNAADRRLALSRTEAILDVLVAGCLPLARAIADLTDETFHANWEYEDDYCFFLFVHQVVKAHDPFPRPDILATLDRFHAALEGAPSGRYSACRALADRDPTAFFEALRVLLDEEQAANETRRDSAAVHEGDVCYWPRSRLSVDGLALLQLAALLGFPPAPATLPLCSPLARLPWTNDVGFDILEQLEGAP